MLIKFPILILDGGTKGPEGVRLATDNVRFLPSCTVSRNFNKLMTDRLGICKIHLVDGEFGHELWAVWDFPSEKLPNTFHLYPAIGGVWDKAKGYFNLSEVAICLTPNEDERIKSLQFYAGVEVVEEIPQVTPVDADKKEDPGPPSVS
jgi:hypothetical protein